MPALNLAPIRAQYKLLAGPLENHAPLEDLWTRCRELIDGTTQHGGATQFIEITAVSMLCEERLWPKTVAPEDARRHQKVALSQNSLVSYMLAGMTMIYMEHTDPQARWNAALELLQELPDLALQMQSPTTDKQLAADLVNAMKIPAAHA